MRTADRAAWEAFAEFHNRLRAETWPKYPSQSAEDVRRNWQNLPRFWEERVWIVPDDAGRVLARGALSVPRTEDNQHVVDFAIEVRPGQRRRGLGTRLLERVVETTRREGRSLLISETEASIPAGRAFMERLGAQMALASHTNRLVLAELDRELVRRWLRRGHERCAGEFELVEWEGPSPEEHLPAVVKLRTIMNTAPLDDLEVEDRQYTVERVREGEAAFFRRGYQRRTLAACQRASGELVGYTEVFWRQSEPGVLQQGDTGVESDYRCRGLGRWLKAAMLEWVLTQRPDFREIHTGNADSNAPMLKINCELGFRPYKTWQAWQVKLEQVVAYLAARGAG